MPSLSLRPTRIALLSLPALVLALFFASQAGCRDISRFSSAGDSYQGAVVKAEFVRAGIADDARVCLTLDADHLQDAPGRISTSDGRFHLEPLRPIPQLWHDPLSTLAFGEGREKNLLYIATPTAGTFDGGSDSAGDVTVIVSLMSTGDLEVRLFRGAPLADVADVVDAGPATPPAPGSTNLFAVFQLGRQGGPCSF